MVLCEREEVLLFLTEDPLGGRPVGTEFVLDGASFGVAVLFTVRVIFLVDGEALPFSIAAGGLGFLKLLRPVGLRSLEVAFDFGAGDSFPPFFLPIRDVITCIVLGRGPFRVGTGESSGVTTMLGVVLSPPRESCDDARSSAT